MVLLPAVLAIYETQAEKDQAAALFEAHHNTMYCEARKILASHEDAEDAVQEAFIILHGHLEGLEDIDCRGTRSYVVKVAINVARNMLRKRLRKKTVPLDELLYDLPSVDEKIFEQTEVEVILEEIRRLPDIPREALLLKYHYECSDKELAAIMGIKHAAANKRIERARALLAGRLMKLEL